MNPSLFNCAEVVPPPIRLIVGAGGTTQDGWVSLQQNDLDIRDARSWESKVMPGSVDAVLSEHVFEHLDLNEATATAWNPSPNYLNWVAPNSSGERFLKMFRQPDEPDHKWLWNYQTLVAFLMSRGFRVVLLEYFDGKGRFHKESWNPENGNIRRCAGSGWSNFLSVVVNAPYTSLIVDAIKICS